MVKAGLAGLIFWGAFSGLCTAEVLDWRTGEAIWATEPIEIGPGVCLAHRNESEFALSYADFSGGDLSFANFSFSVLDGARFIGSNLSGVNFSFSRLADADFTDAVITSADFSGSNFSAAQLYSTRSYQDRDLRGIVFSYKDLSGGDFHGQNLAGATFVSSSAVGATFQGADLSGSVFNNVSFDHTDFSDALINGVVFWESAVSRQQLMSTRSYQDKDLSGVVLPMFYNLSSMDLSGFNLAGADFSRYIDLHQTEFTDAIINGGRFGSHNYPFSKEKLISTLSYKQKDLSGVKIEGGDYTGVDFSGFDLTDAGFVKMNLAETDFTDAVIVGCDFSGSLNFKGVQFYSTKSYQDRDLRGVKLNALNLTNGDFREQNLQGASFQGANLTGVDFTGADLTNASFRGSSGDGTHFTDAVIRGADFSRDMQTSQFLFLSAYQLYSTKSYKDKDLSGIDFSISVPMIQSGILSYDLSEQNLTGANFSGRWLYGSFERAILHNTNFTDALLSERANFSDTTSRGFTREQFYSTLSYKNKELYGGVLSHNDMSNWDFSQMRLYDVDFSSCDLSGALFTNTSHRTNNFSGSDLSGADFRGSQLDRSRFIGANLSGADFRGSVVEFADFTGAIIRYADFSQSKFNDDQLYSTQSYQDRDLRGIILKDRNLSGGNFSGQDLSGADFSGTTLFDTDFSGAVIRGADFSNTTGKGFVGTLLYSTQSYQDKDLRDVQLRYNVMPGADFRGQDLTGADLTGSTLTGADFTDARVQYADFSATTGFIGLQLYSTRSYQDKELRGIGLAQRNLEGADFEGVDLTGANFYASNLNQVNMTDALVNWVNFEAATGFLAEQFRSTQSFKNQDIRGVRLCKRLMTGFDLSDFDLSYVDFTEATLADVPMQNARISGARLTHTTDNGFTKDQLYATKNWQDGDLSEVHLDRNDLSEWDFSGQNLSGANFAFSLLRDTLFDDAVIRNADFSKSTFHALQLYSTRSYQNRDLRGIKLAEKNLHSGYFYGQSMTDADLTGSLLSLTDFSLADLRGVKGFEPTDTTCLRSTILPDGTVEGLMLYAAEVLIIRPYAMPIRVRESMRLPENSTLQLILSDGWSSTFVIDCDTAVVLGGVLRLEFEEGIDVDGLIGKSFALFEWGDALSEGQRFSDVITPVGYEWDLSRLYTHGSVTLIPEPATVFLTGCGLVWIVVRRARAGARSR